ncbi:hypothetical protein GGI20_004970, partial [Coemansia sp. BCRC 34301]
MSSKYTFVVVLTRDAFPEATGAEVTAYFSDSPGDHELVVLCPELPPTADSLELVYTGTLNVSPPKAVSHAECRVGSLDTVISMAGLADDSPALQPGVVRADVSNVRVPAAAADDEGVDLVATADPPPAPIDAAVQTSAEGSGEAGPLAALRNLSQTCTAHSSCADLTLSDLKNVSSQAAAHMESTDESPCEPDSAPAEYQEPAEASELLELDAEVESDSVSISELRDASAIGVLENDTELSSEPECVELQELVDDTQGAGDVTGLIDDSHSTTALEPTDVEELAGTVIGEEVAVGDKSTGDTYAATSITEPTELATAAVGDIGRTIDEPVAKESSIGADEVADEPTVEAAEAVAEEPAVEAVEAVTEEPAVEAVEVVAEEPAVEAVEAVAEEPAVEAAETVADEPAVEAVEAVAEEPAVEAVEVVAEEPAIEAVEA